MGNIHSIMNIDSKDARLKTDVSKDQSERRC